MYKHIITIGIVLTLIAGCKKDKVNVYGAGNGKLSLFAKQVTYPYPVDPFPVAMYMDTSVIGVFTNAYSYYSVNPSDPCSLDSTPYSIPLICKTGTHNFYGASLNGSLPAFQVTISEGPCVSHEVDF